MYWKATRTSEKNKWSSCYLFRAQTFNKGSIKWIEIILLHASFLTLYNTLHCWYIINQAGKTSSIRRIAVRETGISRHHGVPIHSTIVLRGIRESLNWASITPRETLFFRTVDTFSFQSGYNQSVTHQIISTNVMNSDFEGHVFPHQKQLFPTMQH